LVCILVLWPLFNYIIWNDATDGRIEKTQWNYYEAVNQTYADLVVDQYQSGDTIWIHDYHLLLVPSMVRSKLPKAKIGLFVHSPFPSSEIFRCLPSIVGRKATPIKLTNRFEYRAPRDLERHVGRKSSWFSGR
jgi:trehalose-6-phosphate synthase